ncbi:MAG: AAA family ATPase, partial [Deltaproteobacteria bacterium]|nr:AAA family ATPase [Deltaproteobacteria bacterium]
MGCTRCGFDNPANMRFCGKCGSKLALTCPRCAFSNPPEFRFCGGCGSDLTKPVEPAAVDYAEPKSYTPKHLTERILTTRSALEGERKLVTVLFADVANYTSLAEKLDPEEAHRIMDGCFRILLDEIHKCEGTINQFTGDGVMALFGAPVAHEDHAQRACHAALAIQKSLGEYGEQVRKDNGAEFRMRIGLNSGPVIVGRIGDDLRMDYTAIGDTTNLASRMQSLAEPGSNLVSANTCRAVSGFFELESLGKRTIKGKEAPQEVYRLLGPGVAQTRLAASLAKGLTPFVGRERELAALREAWEKAASGLGQVVGIVGEAGVGKSRLLLELRNLLDPSSHTYLEGRCLHFGGTMPYLPILDLLRLFFEVPEGGREAEIRKGMREKVLSLDPQLEEVQPPLQDLLSLTVEDEAYRKLEPRQKKERVFAALRDLFSRISQERPLVLAIEDLHWVDATSREFLDYFLGWIANSPILLLLLYRPEFTHPWASRSYYTQVNVGHLSAKTSTELMASILREGEIARELQDLILQRTEGNPLFLEELTHSLLESGSIEKKEHRYVLGRSAGEVTVPDTIQGIIAARIDRLEENLKRTMQVASVIGREFAFQLLQATTGLREELKSHLLNLQGLEFIYEKKLFPELEYIFKHILTQEVAYNSLLSQRRKELHGRIGAAIEQIYADRLEEFYEMLAYHYGKGDRPEKTLRYLRLSADKAKRSHSLWEALRFHKESLALLRQMPEAEGCKKERVTVIVSMMPIAARLGYPEVPTEILREGEALCRDLGDRRGMVLMDRYAGLYHSYSGDVILGRTYLERSFHEAEKLSDLQVLAQIAHSLFANHTLDGHYAKTVEAAPQVVRLLEASHRTADDLRLHANLYSQIYGMYGLCLGFTGEFEKGQDLCKKAVSLARDVDDPFSIGI